MAKWADNEAPAEDVLIRHHTSYQELRSLSPSSPTRPRTVTIQTTPSPETDTKPQKSLNLRAVVWESTGRFNFPASSAFAAAKGYQPGWTPNWYTY